MEKQKRSCVPVEALVDRRSPDSVLQLATAEREMCAFLRAVHSLFGRSALEKAANLWIGAFQELDDEQVMPGEDFRRITIRAAAQLAAELSRAGSFGLDAISNGARDKC